MEENSSQIDKKKYDRAFFYDIFLGRPQQAGEIAEFVFWLHTYYRARSLFHPSDSVDKNQLTGLDIGCGLGRLFYEFVNRGWHVWGYEPDEDYYNMSVAAARSLTSHNESRKVVVEKKGFLGLDVHNEFDMVIAINGPFYYLLQVEERMQALKNVFNSLKPGGIIFLDLANFIYYLSHYNPEAARKPHVIQYQGNVFERAPSISVNWHEATWDHTDRFSMDGELIYEETHRFAIITLPDLIYQLKLCGFENIQTFNNWHSRENEKIDGPRMLVAAQKPYLYYEGDTTKQNNVHSNKNI